MSYQILMDSCGDLSEGMRNNEHLRMIPLQIRVGQKEWPDDGHINKQELFDEILETDVLPKSACPHRMLICRSSIKMQTVFM